ncbi:MAG: bifunctional phosphoribosylaminoimidazolecarboxamide formyltransferase/IMP cyclohydrolase [Nitrospinota bacterium]
MESLKIKRAIISVSDKTGLLSLARALNGAGVEIVSTGGTAKTLIECGVDVTKVSDYTGFPEIMGGRVKTLHPKIHGGILSRRTKEDIKEMADNQIEPIDMVVINLYPFEQTVAGEGVTEEEAVENIDIGGPCMIRAAAKNFRHVAVVTDPADYAAVIEALEGGIPLEERRRLSYKAFAKTSAYDAAIHRYLSQIKPSGKSASKEDAPDKFNLDYKKIAAMRYGENPHQTAALYAKYHDTVYTGKNQLQGKELSYNNIVDVSAAMELAREFDKPCAVIIKHTNPCGVAVDDDQTAAYLKALECDPVSAFGGIIAFNRPLEGSTAKEISKLFAEAIIAPDYDEKALTVLKKKKNLRIIKPEDFSLEEEHIIKNVVGGLLVQSPDNVTLDEKTLKVVSKRKPTDEEMDAMKFAWTVAKHVKSNAIVYARDGRTVGVGAGQMSRIDSAKIAGGKAQSSIKGCVMSSDAFFPFRDGIDAAGKAGITAVIQPGGSVRDDEVIEAADEYGMAMVFTGIRHFRH